MAAMSYKNKSSEETFASRGYHFLIESIHKPGKFVLFEYEAPFKDQSESRLMVHKMSSAVQASSPSSQPAFSVQHESSHSIGMYVSINITV
jgi:hypothetical protein